MCLFILMNDVFVLCGGKGNSPTFFGLASKPDHVHQVSVLLSWALVIISSCKMIIRLCEEPFTKILTSVTQWVSVSRHSYLPCIVIINFMELSYYNKECLKTWSSIILIMSLSYFQTRLPVHLSELGWTTKIWFE